MCSNESHAFDKRTNTRTLRVIGVDVDDRGVVRFVWLHCASCNSTLGRPPVAEDIRQAETA